MMKITQTLAPEKREVERDGETTIVQIVPQMVSSLRLDLIFWKDLAGYLVD